MNYAGELTTLNYAIVFIYLAAMFAIGLALAGKQHNTEDCFLAGLAMRRPGWRRRVVRYAWRRR